ncbi:MAG: type II toxin-antitoxin system RelE/ParE family toxin [Culturomica sp.]|jgi:phage-related protein|nr:type II toxin-antitoxin system RelE/ParE family toxin [Culturomica sp.]
MGNYKFRIDFLEKAERFLDGMNEKARRKVLYNIWKVRSTNDKELFEKLQGEIWEFRTKYNQTYYRLFAFGDRTDKTDTIVVVTHGLVKKTDKISRSEIKQAEKWRERYFSEKRAADEEV